MKKLSFLVFSVLLFVSCDIGSFDFNTGAIGHSSTGSSGYGYSVCYRGIVVLEDGTTLEVHEVAMKYRSGSSINTALEYMPWGLMNGLVVGDIPGLPNLSEVLAAKADLDGQSNTETIAQYSDSGAGSVCGALKQYVGFMEFLPDSQYYLPAAGELVAIMKMLPDSPSRPSNLGFWSSTEYDSAMVWSVGYRSGLDSLGLPNLNVLPTRKDADRYCLCASKL